MNKVRVGLIGIRGFGEKRATSILQSSCLQLTRIYHPEWGVCQEVSRKMNAHPSRTLEEFYGDPELQAIMIATPTHLHFDQIKKGLTSGKHIFVEKPLTLKLSEALELKKILSSQNKMVMVGHSYRRKKGIRRLKGMLAEGRLGNLVSIEINFSHGGGFNFTSDQWRWNASLCPGGPLSMLGTHAFDTLEYLGGGVKTLQSLVRRLYAPTEAEDTSCHLIELKSGGSAYIASHYNTPSYNRIWIAGTEGLAWWDSGPPQKIFCRSGRDLDRKPSPLQEEVLVEEDFLIEEMNEFGRCILSGQKIETGFEEGLRATAFVEAALESAKSGKKIDLDRFLGERESTLKR